MNPEIIDCNFCDCQFDSWNIYDRHLKAMHNKIRILVCKLCHERCKGVDNFDKHLTFVHGTNHWHINLAMKYTERRFKDLMGYNIDSKML